MESIDAKLQRQIIRDRRWLIAVIMAAVVMYIPTFRYLWEKWMDDAQYSLSYLVPCICVYFVWQKLPEIKALPRSSARFGAVLIVIALILHLVGTVLDVSGFSSVSIIFMLVGGCAYLHSASLVKLLWFPLAYTVFMVPIPGGVIDKIGHPMQLFASGMSADLLQMLRIDVIRAGIQLTVDGFDFTVAPACSGMSSLVALMGVTAVYAYMTKLPAIYQWALFALSMPIAIAANIMRITAIALLGYLWDWDKAMAIHKWAASPILFMFAILLLFAINWGFEWLSARRTTS